MKSKKTIKFIKLICSIVLISICLFVYSSLFGNPISYLRAKKEINAYIDDKYKGELVIESMGYNFKLGGYDASVARKEDGRDTSYITYSRYGNISDGYQFEVRLKMEEEVKSIIESLVTQGTHLGRENLGVEPSIEIPEFKYDLHDNYSGKEPISLVIWLHPPYSYTGDDKNNNVYDEVALHKNEDEFAKDAYDVIKVLQNTNYNFGSIEIYSYQEDGNTSYRVKLGDNEKVSSLDDVKNKVYIKASEK